MSLIQDFFDRHHTVPLTVDERKMQQLAERINKQSSAFWYARLTFEHPDEPALVQCFYRRTAQHYHVSSWDEWEQVRNTVEHSAN